MLKLRHLKNAVRQINDMCDLLWSDQCVQFYVKWILLHQEAVRLTIISTQILFLMKKKKIKRKRDKVIENKNCQSYFKIKF